MPTKTKTTQEPKTMTQQIKDGIDEMQTRWHELHGITKELKQKVRVLQTKTKYRPNDGDLAAEFEVATDTLAENEAELEALLSGIHAQQEHLAVEQAKAEQNRLLKDSESDTFTVPEDDPILACQLLAAMADRLQYAFLSSEGFYEALLGRVYGHNAGDEARDHVRGDNDHPNPEIARSDIDQLDELRERRERIQRYRFAVEREFKRLSGEIPAESSYRPVLLRRTDAQRAEELERRRQQQYADRLEQSQQAREQARAFTSVERRAYQPGIV